MVHEYGISRYLIKITNSSNNSVEIILIEYADTKKSAT